MWLRIASLRLCRSVAPPSVRLKLQHQQPTVNIAACFACVYVCVCVCVAGWCTVAMFGHCMLRAAAGRTTTPASGHINSQFGAARCAPTSAPPLESSADSKDERHKKRQSDDDNQGRTARLAARWAGRSAGQVGRHVKLLKLVKRLTALTGEGQGGEKRARDKVAKRRRRKDVGRNVLK